MTQHAPIIEMTYTGPGQFSFDPEPQPAKNNAKTDYEVRRTDGSPCKIRMITFENPNNPSQSISFTEENNGDNDGDGGSFCWPDEHDWSIRVTAIRVNPSNTKFCLNDQSTNSSEGVLSFTIGVEDLDGNPSNASDDPQITIKGSQ